MRQMTLVAFLQAQNCTNFVGSWRHPEASPDFMTADYYRHIARVLEAGKFHVGFFDDRLAMPDRYGGDHAHTVANGIRCVKMDPITILTVMGMATERLGLGSTCSTTYYEPFHVARVFQTLDLMTNGRAAWNIVTSMNDGEALNMGHAAHGEHDQRYDRADEFLEVVVGHWDSWDDDAIVLDKRTGLLRASRQGATAGPYRRILPFARAVHRAALGAGASGADPGRAERTRPSVRGALGGAGVRQLPLAGTGAADYAAFKQQIAETGRDPEKVAVAAGVYTVVAETRAEAEDKVALIDSLPKEIDQLSLLCEVLNVDLAKKPLDEPWSEEEILSWTGAQGLRDRVYRILGKRNPTTRDFMEVSHRGTFRDHPRFVGSPKDVADGMEEWFATRACDGYVVAASHVPGGYEEFVRYVVPELQRRGVLHNDYRGTTLRENLGLERPRIGA